MIFLAREKGRYDENGNHIPGKEIPEGAEVFAPVAPGVPTVVPNAPDTVEVTTDAPTKTETVEVPSGEPQTTKDKDSKKA